MSILDLDLISLRSALTAGQISARELMQETLEKIDAVNPKFNAIVSSLTMTNVWRQRQPPIMQKTKLAHCMEFRWP